MEVADILREGIGVALKIGGCICEHRAFQAEELKETEDGFRYIVLRLGDQVWDVGVRSDRPTEDLLSEYAAVLAEFQ